MEPGPKPSDSTPDPKRAAAPSADSTSKQSEALVAVLYAELRKLATARMARLAPGNTLQATALVHEAFIRLSESGSKWNDRGHFFGAAARAMKQILIDQARRKKAIKHGGDRERLNVDDLEIALDSELPAGEMLALDQALERLQVDDPRKAEIVLLRYFAGLEREEISELLGVSVRTVDRDWKFSIALLQKMMAEQKPNETG